MTNLIEKSVLIDALPAEIWPALTEPTLMTQWMAEPTMNLTIETTWVVGQPILMQGFQHVPFENRGTVLAVEPHARYQYCYLSSISRLPDQPENYTTVDLSLQAIGGQTQVTATLTNFPTESILKHVNFYWQVVLIRLKKLVEETG